MENQKRSKKVLKTLINDAVLEAISHLEIPEPTKKVKKIVDRSAKKLAGEFSAILKKDEKKKKKAEKLLHAAVNGESKSKRKAKKIDSVIISEPIKL